MSLKQTKESVGKYMKHILIAEDQQSARFVLIFHLKKAGFKVTAVENGVLALNFIQNNLNTENQIDLLVTDIEMPEMSGLDLYKKLADLNIKIPIIVMTAYGTKHIVIELMRMGCSEYLDKPFPNEELVARINQIFDEEEKKKSDSKKIEDDNYLLLNELNNYKISSKMLKEQVNSAKVAFDNITKIEDDNLNVNFCYRLRPLADLGGDLLSIKNTEKGCDILLADVAGHDIGSSFHTILIKNIFEDNVKNKKSGSEFFAELNKRLISDSKDNRLVTAIFIQIDLTLMKAEITSAAHPLPIFIKNGSNMPKQINACGDVLGIFEEVYFEPTLLDIQNKDRILFYTDGIEDSGHFELETGNKVKLKDVGILKLVAESNDFELNQFVENIWEKVKVFGQNNAKDDMSLVAIEIK
jgi:DNA-binding response OmpR family regulator